MQRLLLSCAAAAAITSTPAFAQGELLARSVLDAASFRAGPSSGLRIGTGTINGVDVPFVGRQPIQGFSAILPLFDGFYMAMSDNGFGSFENSADYLLSVYLIRPNFETPFGGPGTMDVVGVLRLSDPNNLIPFPITNEFVGGRPLTGADFDIESIQLAPDFTIWIGDEFGPYMLHFDLLGRLLEAPIALPDGQGGEIRAPQNGGTEEASAVRVLNAVYRHGSQRGRDPNLRPVFSPWHVMLDDGDASTSVGSRDNPAAGSGLTAASSELFNVRSIQRAGYPVVVYTVNDTPRMNELLALGVDGIISDRPDLLLDAIRNFDADGDGTPGDYLDAQGLIDITKCDAQGHRGARNLRPENTLPSMEAALDTLMTTLEFDLGITADGIAVLGHDPYLSSSKVRRANGQPYGTADEVLIKDLTAAQIQQQFIADKLLSGRPAQTNDRALSPVTSLFTLFSGLPDQYTIPTLEQVFDFVSFYENFYRTGLGSTHAEAELRWRNAARVRFNIETKINPRSDRDVRGNVYADRTIDAQSFANIVVGSIVARSLQARADIQSFDFRTLLQVQDTNRDIRTVYLFGDFAQFADPSQPGSSDGTNLQPQNAGGNTPWLAGLEWPYRVTEQSIPFIARSSGGFEGMAQTTDGTRLLAMLERPLTTAAGRVLRIAEFDLATHSYNGVVHEYPLDPRGTAIGDFVMISPTNGIVIERDGTQGDLNGHKKIYEIRLQPTGGLVSKREALDLLTIRDPSNISLPGLPGDVGIGSTFAFPFVTIEGLIHFNDRYIGICNDNNFPFSIGRHVGTGRPDDNEFIVVQLDTPLGGVF